MIWYIEDYRRNRLERVTLEALASRVDWLTPLRWRVDDAVRLIWDADIAVNGRIFSISLRYPNHFPHSPPVVLPRGTNEFWSMHQYGPGGELCLEFGPDNWHPTLTGADMIRSAHRLLQGERPSAGEQGTVASRHQTTLGQDLRGKFARYLVTDVLESVLAKIPADAMLSARIISLLHEDSYVGLVASIVMPDGTVWSGDLPQPLKHGYQRNAPLFRWPETLPFPPTDTLTAFRAVVAQRMSALAPDAVYALVLHRERLRPYFLDKDADSLVALAVIPPQPHAERMDSDHQQLRDRMVGVVGCGSLGSKVAVSLARAGVGRFLLVDDDILFPDNFVRHDLDWRDVGTHKADSVAARIQLVSPAAKCEMRKHRLGGQESSGSVETLIELLAGCDLLIDATAEPAVFTYLAAAAGFGKKSLLWAEVFGGGLGGLIARHRPRFEPDPATMRRAIENWCLDRGRPIAHAATDYGGAEAAPMVADDADVTVISAHAARMAIDTLIPRNPSAFPSSVYVIGLREGWIFDQPFETYPIDVGPAPASDEESDVDADAMAAELDRILKLFAEHRHETDPAGGGGQSPSQ